MSAFTKCAGLLAGLSTVAVIGVAVAQGQPPNPMITNHAIGAGQQSTHVTPMGETGVLAQAGGPRPAPPTTPGPRGAQPRPRGPTAPAPGRNRASNRRPLAAVAGLLLCDPLEDQLASRPHFSREGALRVRRGFDLGPCL